MSLNWHQQGVWLPQKTFSDLFFTPFARELKQRAGLWMTSDLWIGNTQKQTATIPTKNHSNKKHMNKVVNWGQHEIIKSIENIHIIIIQKSRQRGLVVSMSASHAVGRRFASRSLIPKTIIKMVLVNYFPAWYAGIRVGVWQCSLTI